MKRLAVVLALFTAAVLHAAVAERFTAGETIDYDLKWARMAGGSARLTIAPADEARYRITFVARSGRFFSRLFKVRDEIETIVRRDNFSTLQYRKKLDERGRLKDELTVVDEAAHTATRKNKTFAVPGRVVDPLSVIVLLRTLSMEAGATHRFDVLADGKVYSMEAQVIRRESLTTPGGVFKTVVVEPKMRGSSVFGDSENRLWIWYSDDERRLPVQIRSEVRVGSITATLRKVSDGVSGIEPPAEAVQ